MVAEFYQKSISGMWGKRSQASMPIDNSKGESELGTSLEMENDITDREIDAEIKAEYGNSGKPKHKTYRINPDFGNSFDK